MSGYTTCCTRAAALGVQCPTCNAQIVAAAHGHPEGPVVFTIHVPAEGGYGPHTLTAMMFDSALAAFPGPVANQDSSPDDTPECAKCEAAGFPPHGGDLPAAFGTRPCGWPDTPTAEATP